MKIPKIKIEFTGLEIAATGQRPKLPWYYGFSYKAINKFALVFHIIPLNIATRFWLRLNQFKYQLLRLLLYIKPIRDWVIKKGR